MADQTLPWQSVAYEGFEIHVAAFVAHPPGESGRSAQMTTHPAAPSAGGATDRYTYVGYVCHPGANPAIPGHAVPFHADGEESFASDDEAIHEGVHVGRSIVDGTHPDLTVLPLVTGGV
ncbi:hypothetical protein LFL96_05340 [Paraburkholderia sp. D15]|uniref:hypothetical protein n=1 Tax=Paraburkholderia sp. D15 TaxID=2880218 RepID=UPI0024792220|nr:hypothetical protein [Paraburkholderia sp. D15]WGS50930.1 hypothetical protein LFL96_05340 [Paraburkholderia sp. D15]WKF58907.1 hypothetical protein HUO10_003409 [Paraburkholderia busanensis]